jgi:hypothetical protein
VILTLALQSVVSWRSELELEVESPVECRAVESTGREWSVNCEDRVQIRTEEYRVIEDKKPS